MQALTFLAEPFYLRFDLSLRVFILGRVHQLNLPLCLLAHILYALVYRVKRGSSQVSVPSPKAWS